MTLVLRISKGEALTYEELDGNFTTLNDKISVLEGNIPNWNTAFSWGNHALAGYLTFYEETDPVFTASVASTISQQNITNWGQAYNWGNHANAGYLTSISNLSINDLHDVDFTDGVELNDVIRWNGQAWVAAATPFTEIDPVFTASPAAGIGNTEITNWNSAYGWGDHASAGYLAASEPAGSITSQNISNWDTAYGWGNHASAGYLTAAPAVSISDTVPFSPDIGDLWWKSDEGVLKIYYNDGNSFQWVDATPAAGYTLPTASPTTLGGVTVDNSTITATSGEITAVGISSNSSSISIGNLTLTGGLTTYTNTLHIDATGSDADFVGVTGHYIPTTNATWDLGSAEYKIRDQYISTQSDVRLKHNITDYYEGLEFIQKLRVVDFTWNQDVPQKGGKRQTGLIAQEVADALEGSTYNSWLLHDDRGPYHGLDQTQLIPALISALQELHNKIKELEGQINGN